MTLSSFDFRCGRQTRFYYIIGGLFYLKIFYSTTSSGGLFSLKLQIREQYETAPLMFMVDLHEPLDSSPLRSRSPALFVVHQSTAVDSSKPSCLVYRKSRPQAHDL